MPSEKAPFYDPVPPTYDEALASGSRREYAWERTDERDADEGESQSLLRQPESSAGPSRSPHGYRPPTVETDDESSLFGGDSDIDDDDEAAHVRREMQEMDVEEPSPSRPSRWGKRIGFSLSLPRWKWSWRPRLPRIRIQLPSRAPEASADETSSETETPSQTRRWAWPKVDPMTMFVMFVRTMALIFVLGFVYFLFVTGFFGSFTSGLHRSIRYDPEEVKRFMQENVDPMNTREYVKHFSSYAHIAGTEGDLALKDDVILMFERSGLAPISVEQLSVYTNYPLEDANRTIQIMGKDGSSPTWTAKLDEDERGGETFGRQTYSFHAHSKAGDVKGPLIYANYGSREDFRKIKDMDIDAKGAIALVRYHGTQSDPALKVKAAELAGFAGCIIYSDPADNGYGKGDVAPSGRYLPEDGVQRASVSLMSWVVGDPLTPVWSSEQDLTQISPEDSLGLVKIPSLPLSARDARILLQHLKGHGQKVPEGWQGGVQDVEEWWTGDMSSPVVRLNNNQAEERQRPIWNVHAEIMGAEQDGKEIIIGNHRDSLAFGASDPHSGTAVMMEVARVFGLLASKGWRPLRTIRFVSWDAGEYNAVGSTEFVENRIEALRSGAYAYINLDAAVTGMQFTASGSPLMERPLLRALERIEDPHANISLKQLWDDREAKLEGLGGGGDFVAFQDIAGTSSIDLKFVGDMLPSRSSFDNFDLVDRVVDPGFAYHGLMCQVVGLLILDLADRDIMPFGIVNYGRRLRTWVNELKTWVGEKSVGKDSASKLPFNELEDAVKLVNSNAEVFEKWELEWDRLFLSNGGFESNSLGEQRLAYNEKMAGFETALLDTEQNGGVSFASLLV